MNLELHKRARSERYQPFNRIASLRNVKVDTNIRDGAQVSLCGDRHCAEGIWHPAQRPPPALSTMAVVRAWTVSALLPPRRSSRAFQVVMRVLKHGYMHVMCMTFQVLWGDGDR